MKLNKPQRDSRQSVVTAASCCGRLVRIIGGAMMAVMLFVTLPVSANPGRLAFRNDLLGLSNASSYARLDTSFSSHGFLTDSFAPNFNLAQDVAVQADGRIVIAGPAGITSIGLIRYNSDGSRDAAFGVDGKVTEDIASILSTTSSLALQPDGKIVVVGSQVTMGEGPSQVIYVARYNPDGTRDWITRRLGVPFPACTQVHVCANQYMIGEGSAVVVQSDGKIIAGGYAAFANTPLAVDTKADFALVRVNSDGTRDESFGSQGGVRQRIVDDHDSIADIALQPDGKIVAAGSATIDGKSQFALARFNANGTLDTTFHGDGKLTMPVLGSGDVLFNVEIQPDGNIVAAGEAFNGSHGELAVVRFNPDGSLDTSFSGDGKATTAFYGRGGNGRALMINADGKIIVAGNASNGNNSDFALVRYNSDGVLDRSFDLDGRAVFDLGMSDDHLSSFAADASGRFVAAGRRQNEVAVARISADVSISNTPYDFNADGKADLAVYRPSNNQWYVQTPDAFSTRQWGEAGDEIAPADYDGDGRTDFAVFRPSNGTWYLINSASQTFQAVPWGEEGDMPVASDMNADGRADLVVYRDSNSTWYTRFAGSGGNYPDQYGEIGNRPVKGDFDGDGVPDLAAYGSTDHTWRIKRSTGGEFITTWGDDGDVPVPADYDGDGSTDIAVWRPSSGRWYIIGSSWGWMTWNVWGEEGDIPVPADYDGDGRTDIAIWRPSNATWYVVYSSTNGIYIRQFGAAGDIPVPSAFIY